MRTLRAFLLVFFFCAPATAQTPVITKGPYNAASYAAVGQPNAGIAQGAMFVLVGTGMGPNGIVIVNAFPLPTTLSETSVHVTMGGNSYNAIMIYTLSLQVAAILPSNVPLGNGTVTVTYQGRVSAPVPIRVVARAFGIFTRNQAGTGPGIVQNYNSAVDVPTNSLVDSAHSAQYEIIWGTGLGAVAGNEAAGGLPGDFNIPVEVYVGGKLATVTYRGRSSDFPALDQIQFIVPPGVEGCYVSVVVRAGGVASNFVTMSITPAGRVCTDHTGLTVADLEKVAAGSAVSVGNMTMARTRLDINGPGLTVLLSVDHVEGRFRRYATVGDVLSMSTLVLGDLDIMSPGSCLVSPFEARSEVLGNFLLNAPDTAVFQTLDAGPAIRITGPAGTQNVLRQNTVNNLYTGDIGGGLPGRPQLPAFLNPGNFSLTNTPGGTGVGSFNSAVVFPANTPAWINRAAISNIPRSQDLTINWNGGVAGTFVAVAGSSADPVTGAAAQFTCTARAEANNLVVPSLVLSAMPASGLSAAFPVGFLGFVVVPAPAVHFTATGIDFGVVNTFDIDYKNVVFQ